MESLSSVKRHLPWNILRIISNHRGHAVQGGQDGPDSSTQFFMSPCFKPLQSARATAWLVPTACLGRFDEFMSGKLCLAHQTCSVNKLHAVMYHMKLREDYAHTVPGSGGESVVAI